ncbi:MAG: hypothetical protein AMXMBFR75_29370 [Candidatus Hinthialibacteria bacterium]
MQNHFYLRPSGKLRQDLQQQIKCSDLALVVTGSTRKHNSIINLGIESGKLAFAWWNDIHMSIDNQSRARAVCIPDASEVATTGVVNAIDRKRILRIGCEVIRKTDSFDPVAQG